MSQEYVLGGQPEEVVVPPAADGSPAMSENAEGTPAVSSEQSSDSSLVPSDGGGPVVPAGLRDVDPAKLAEIREKLGRFLAKGGKTVSGSEDPDAPAAEPTADNEGRPVGKTMTGADVDWSEYDLQYDVRHLYPRASFRETPQGPKWVAVLDEFYSTEKDARSHGKRVNMPGSVEGMDKEPQNLGEYLTEMTNGAEGWAIAAILPGSMGKALVVMRKQTAVVLPDPTPLKKTEEVEAPKDPELQNIEDAALAFAQDEGLTPPPMVEDNESGEAQLAGEDLSGRFLSRAEVDVPVEETGAIVARDSGTLVQQALAKAAPMTVDPIAPAGIQPDAFEDERGQKHAAGVVNIALGMRNILAGEDFGDVTPPTA